MGLGGGAIGLFIQEFRDLKVPFYLLLYYTTIKILKA
jgi:hypothetical protein